MASFRSRAWSMGARAAGYGYQSGMLMQGAGRAAMAGNYRGAMSMASMAAAPFARSAGIAGLAGAGLYGYRGSRRRGRGVVRAGLQGAAWSATAWGGYRGAVAGAGWLSRMLTK